MEADRQLRRALREAEQLAAEEQKRISMEADRQMQLHQSLREAEQWAAEERTRKEEQPLASYFYKNIRRQIAELEQELNANQQIAAYCYLPANEVICVERLGWANPNMIVLQGRDLLQNPTVACLHMTATNIVLKVVSAEKPVERRPIGFLGELRSSQPSALADEADHQE